MLAVGLHKLCGQGSFDNAPRRVENRAKIVPRRVENRPAGGPKWPSGGLLGATWAPFGRQDGSEAEFRRFLEPPGGFWAALGPPWAAPGGVLGAPGRAEGRSGEAFGVFLGPF